MSQKIIIDTPGPHTVTAEYSGTSANYIFSPVTLLIPSSDSTTFDVAAAPTTGRRITGSLTAGATSPVDLPTGSMLLDAPYDPSTGAIGSGRMWFPLGELNINTVIGAVPVRYRLVQLEDVTGQVAHDGTVAFSTANFLLDAREYNLSGWKPMSSCDFPLEMTLTGTADASGLHLAASDVVAPAVPSEDCANQGDSVNAQLVDGLDFVFSVAGDFTPPTPTPTSTSVVSWFPSVAQHNQTYLRASVSAVGGVPTGTVEFRDLGTDVVLGTAQLDKTGHAAIVTAMDAAGARTVVASYAGDGGHGPSQGSTTQIVIPNPVGSALTGSLTIGDVTVVVPTGSVLVPPATTGGSGGSISTLPTTISLDVADYGNVTAEVRLIQVGEFKEGSIDSSGGPSDVTATYALQVRQVTTASETTIPLACLNAVQVTMDRQVSATAVSLQTENGTSARYPLAACVGPGRAVADALTGSVSVQLTSML